MYSVKRRMVGIGFAARIIALLDELGQILLIGGTARESFGDGQSVVMMRSFAAEY